MFQVDAGQIALPEPVLIIEILSPTNESDTWDNVWTYVSIPSVQEVLVLRSTSIAGDLLRRHPDGTWPDEPSQIGTDDTLHLEMCRPDLPARRALLRHVSRAHRVTPTAYRPVSNVSAASTSARADWMRSSASSSATTSDASTVA